MPALRSPGRVFGSLLILLSLLLPSPGILAAQAPPPAAAQAAGLWKPFGPAAFRRAQGTDRLILLVLEVPWSEYSTRARNEVWNQPEVVEAIRERYVAIRERADIRPDLTRRYPAEGWPAVSILLPDGTPLRMLSEETGQPRRVTSGFRPAASMARLLTVASDFYRARRSDAIRMSREGETQIRESSPPTAGKVGESLTWALVSRMESTFDKEHRYFGGPPRIPRFDLIELLLTAGVERRKESTRVMGSAAINTLATHLVDAERGGLYRMALGLEWERPQKEKLLDRNARWLDLLTLRFRISGKRSDRDAALSQARWILEHLDNGDGSLAAAVCASCPDGIDRTVLTGDQAQASAALIRCGAATGDTAILERGLAGARFLREHRYKPGRGMPRAVVDGTGQPPGNLVLEDLAESAWAFIEAYQVTGDKAWLETARDLARTTLANLRDPATGALRDVVPAPSGPMPLRRAVYPQKANARMVRVLVRLHYLGQGERLWRKAAQEILKAFGGSYDRVGLFIPAYALALYEFHFSPEMAVVVARKDQEEGAALRRAAMGSAFPFTLVKTMDPATEPKAIVAAGFSIQARPGLFPFYDGLGGRRIEVPGGVRAALHDLREKRLEQKARAERAGKP
ncbi:MAG: DUF255 domain-containing protein [Acidobacteriota bacterium]|nr:DUF255 domain-containing protein [Acidobacteriota bacterium]